LFGDLWATLMVATFFAFLNDSVSSSSAKRLYGLVGFGGVFGGVFGSTTVRGLIDRIALDQWLWICAGIGLIIVGVAFSAGALARRMRAADTQSEESAPTAAGGNPALEGARLVFRSPYLLSIVGIVGLYEIVSTVLDFQFTATIAHYLSGEAIDRQFATIFTITNWTSMLVQLFLTSFVMTRFGLTTALLVLPLAIAIGSAGFLALPILWVGSFLNTVDNGFSYSINQSAKEALYVPTTRDEKYKAKAFIDMFVQRFAKSVAVGINLLVSTIFLEFTSLRWLSVFTLGIVAVWIMAARHAGRHFAQRERAEAAAP
jgi:AAA family ATP:ADP antiporter